MFTIGSVVVVLTAVQFDNEFDAMTGEVRDIRADRSLPAEMESVMLEFPKITPEKALCIGCFTS